MIAKYKHTRIAILGLGVLDVALLIAGGCGEVARKKILDVPEFSQFRNVNDAPPPLRDAAAGVVRIVSEGGSGGTGFFINDSGILITNNHVLGDDGDQEGPSCLRPGCYAQIDFDYQVGANPQAAKKIYAELLMINGDLDMAVLQIKSLGADGRPSGPLSTPHYLEVEDRGAADLLGESVHVVGHPLLGLKKWHHGKVVYAFHHWFYFDVESLGGNSGSPVLNKDGKVIGLLHRAQDGGAEVTRAGMGGKTIATSSAALRDALGRGLSLTAKDLAKPETIKDVEEFDVGKIKSGVEAAEARQKMLLTHAGYFDDAAGAGAAAGGAGVPGPVKAGGKTHVLFAIGQACDQALAAARGRKAADLTPMRACIDMKNWVNCLTPREHAEFKTCPSDAGERQQFRERMFRLTDHAFRINNPAAITIGVTWPSLFVDKAGLYADVKQNLANFMTKYQPRLDFPLAKSILRLAKAADEPMYQDRKVVDFVRNYQRELGYELFFYDIAQSHVYLFMQGRIDEKEFSDVFRRIMHDPKMTLGDKIGLEAWAYEGGWL